MYDHLGCSAFEQRKFFNVIKKLATYEDLEEKGCLLKLPVAIGDTLYSNMSCSGDYERTSDKPYEHKVVFIGVNGNNNYFNTINIKTKRMFSFLFSDIGKIIFIDKKDAEDEKIESEKKSKS